MKTEALKLADDGLNSEGLSYPETWNLCIKQSQMIRRLVERIDSQENHLKLKDDFIATLIKPLSDEEIHDIWKSLWESGNIGHIAYNYARAIEERHGIK